MKLLKFAEENAAEIYELDNPFLVMVDEVVAADGRLRMSRVEKSTGSEPWAH